MRIDWMSYKARIKSFYDASLIINLNTTKPSIKKSKFIIIQIESNLFVYRNDYCKCNKSH